MGKLDIDDVIKNIKRLMLMVAIWPTRCPTFTYATARFLLIFVETALTVALFIKVFTDADKDTLFLGLCCSLASFHYLAKMFILFYNKEQFHKIINCLKKPILVSHEDHLDIFLQDKVRLCKSWQLIFFFATLNTGVTGILIPMFDKATERPLPLPFPLDMKDRHWLIYCSVYILQSIWMFHACCTFPCIDGIIFSFLAIAAGQLRIVREKIIRAANRHPSAANSLQLQKHYDIVTNDILKQCVKHHIVIARYIMLIEETFKIEFLLQLLTSLFGTCLVGFSFLMLPGTSLSFLRYTFFLLSTVIQLAFFCVPANEIILQSEKIRDACYMSEWTDCSPSVRRTLLIIMERSKRPLSLTAANFAELSLDTFVSVLKSSYFYFTVLKKVYNNRSKT